MNFQTPAIPSDVAFTLIINSENLSEEIDDENNDYYKRKPFTSKLKKRNIRLTDTMAKKEQNKRGSSIPMHT